MQSKEFFEALRMLEEEKGIKKEYFIEALEAGLTAAYKKLYGEAKSAIVKLNPEKNSIKIYSYKTVVDVVEDADKQISLQDARLIKKSYKVGDEILQEENSKNFGRIPSQTVRHVIMQKLKEAVRAKEFAELSEKENTIITAQIIRRENGYYYLNMGGMEAEGVIAEKDCIPGERLEIQSRVKVYVKRIVESTRGCQIQCTRTNIGFVQKLFELEIPEVQNHEVEIKAISREAGYRTKIAVYSANEYFDAVGACVGNRGMRINNIIKELNGEKIDIIPYSEDAK
ncbi:MAG: transcription termination factor NusA, partial [Christensenellales bacterium]